MTTVLPEDILDDTRQVKINKIADPVGRGADGERPRRTRKMTEKALTALANARAKKAQKAPKKQKMRKERSALITKISKAYEADFMNDRDLTHYHSLFTDTDDVAQDNTPASEQMPDDVKKEEAAEVKHETLLEDVSGLKAYSSSGGSQSEAIGPATSSPGMTPEVDTRDQLINDMRKQMELLSSQVQDFNRSDRQFTDSQGIVYI
jgi:hypothetical protein